MNRRFYLGARLRVPLLVLVGPGTAASSPFLSIKTIVLAHGAPGVSELVVVIHGHGVQ
jgi:hypothetical protein